MNGYANRKFSPFLTPQVFSQLRLSEASAHSGSFSTRIKEEVTRLQANAGSQVPFNKVVKHIIAGNLIRRILLI